MFTSRTYWFKVVTAMLLAIASPYILVMVIEAANQLSDEIIGVFRQGNSYNIGILSVTSLDIMNERSCDRLITGVLSGSISQSMILVVATGFISSEFSGGYVNLAIMHGEMRTKLYAKYIGVNAIGSLVPIIIYPVGVALSAMLLYNMQIEDMGLVISTLTLQGIMMLAIVVCISAVSIMFDGTGATIIGLCFVFAMPLIPNYLRIFTNDKINIENYMLISRLVNSSDALTANAAGDIAVALVTAAVFYCIGWMIFATKNFK